MKGHELMPNYYLFLNGEPNVNGPKPAQQVETEVNDIFKTAQQHNNWPTSIFIASEKYTLPEIQETLLAILKDGPQ